MKKITLILITTAIAISSLKAQTYAVYGKVTSKDGTTTKDATVFVEEINIQVNTNEQGTYELKLPKGTHIVQVFSLGNNAASQRVKVDRNLELNFELSEFSENLEEVEISSVRESNGISRLRSVEGFGIYEAKKNELILLDDFAANKVTNNARQVFAKVPGLNIWESDFAGLQLDIAARGLGPSRTANFNTRQNGYDMSADALGYPESYYMPAMQAVDRIEIVRGAASLQYGTQFGGMLNFKLKEAPKEPIQINLEQAAGSFGLLNSFISAGGTIGKVDYYSYYQYRTGDGWRDNSGFDSHLAFTRLGWQANDRLKIGFEYSFMDYQAQQPGGFRQFDNVDLTTSDRPRNWFRVNWNLLANTIDYRFTERTKLNVRSFGLFSRRDALGDLDRAGGPLDLTTLRTLISDEFKNFGSEVRLIHHYRIFGKNSVLLTGGRYFNGMTDRRQGFASSGESDADFTFLNPDAPENFDYQYPGQNYAAFAENLIDINEKLSITPGIRFEHIDTRSQGTWNQIVRTFAGDTIAVVPNQEDRTEKRSFVLLGLGSTYYLRPDLSLYANYSQNYRSITFSDLRIENPSFLLDSLITDERGFNMDLGIRGKLRPWLNVDISLFLLQYNDRIGEFFTTTTSRLFRTNVGDSRHIGIESFTEIDLFTLLGNMPDDQNLSIYTNFSLIDAKYIRAEDLSILGNRVEYVPDVIFRTGINYSWKNLKASYQFSYLSQQFSESTNSTNDNIAIAGIIPSYKVMDLSFEYNPAPYKFTFGVNNLTNEKYFTRRAVSYPGPGIIPATIRSFYFSVGIQL